MTCVHVAELLFPSPFNFEVWSSFMVFDLHKMSISVTPVSSILWSMQQTHWMKIFNSNIKNWFHIWGFLKQTHLGICRFEFINRIFGNHYSTHTKPLSWNRTKLQKTNVFLSGTNNMVSRTINSHCRVAIRPFIFRHVIASPQACIAGKSPFSYTRPIGLYDITDYSTRTIQLSSEKL